MGAVRALVEPLCASHRCALVLVSLGSDRDGPVLRVVIEGASPTQAVPSPEHADRPVTLDDCVAVSRDVSAALDLHPELLPQRYRLEVSSPGAERPLTKEDDFRRFAGRLARVHCRTAIDGQRRFRGVLRGMKEHTICLELDGAERRIPITEIAKAHLVFEG